MKKLVKICPHIGIVLSFVLMVLLVIDNVNAAMNVINNDITKLILLINCIAEGFVAICAMKNN